MQVHWLSSANTILYPPNNSATKHLLSAYVTWIILGIMGVKMNKQIIIMHWE